MSRGGGGGQNAAGLRPLTRLSFVHRPWIVFLAGGMGVGKTHVLRWANEKKYFDASRYVFVDPDKIRYRLPEIGGYMLKDRTTMGAMTQMEAGEGR